MRLSAAESWTADRVEVSRGLVLADLDQDGDLDALVTNGGTRARLYRNQVPVGGAGWR